MANTSATLIRVNVQYLKAIKLTDFVHINTQLTEIGTHDIMKKRKLTIWKAGQGGV